MVIVPIECHLCSRKFNREVDLKTHLRWGTKCISKKKKHAEEVGDSEHWKQNTNETSSSVNKETITSALQQQPDFLYCTVIQDIMSPCSDDNFSIISDKELSNYSVPDDLFHGDENLRPREDGRDQRYIDFVANLVNAHQLYPHRQLSFIENPVYRFQ